MLQRQVVNKKLRENCEKKLKYIISEHNFLMKVLNKRDEQELQTRIFDKSLEHKF